MRCVLLKMDRSHGYCMLAVILFLASTAFPVQAGEFIKPSTTGAPERPVWSSPLTLFQGVISRADGDRCPMYPSCSHYASTVFAELNPIAAWIMTCDRLLRCGHDEVRSAPRMYVNGEPRTYDPVQANAYWWRKP